MKVKELIEKLQGLDQEAVVNIYAGYDYDYGDQWNRCLLVEQEEIRWDKDRSCPVMEVFVR